MIFSRFEVTDSIQVFQETESMTDPFEKHLKFPLTPPPMTANKKENIRLPSAIYSKAWRKHHQLKDKIKQNKN